MASLGFRTINEMIGRCDLLKTASDRLTNKSKFLDLSHILTPAFKLRPGAATFNVTKQNHMLHKRIDNKLISLAAESLKVVTVDAIKITNISVDIVNTDRAFGTTLSYHISRVFGEKGLPDETIIIKAKGSAGQSFAAFLAPGVLIELEGDCNDYVGKGLSGGKLVVYPPKDSIFESAENVIVGNVCLYGATSGYAFISGIAAERFCVRNSGAIAVIEGVGDHGCEYMTGGVVVCLGKVGRNFAAGMSGGYAYILDLDSSFESNCNKNMVDLETVNETNEIHFLRSLIAEHVRLTESKIGKRVLRNFLEMLPKFVKGLFK